MFVFVCSHGRKSDARPKGQILVMPTSMSSPQKLLMLACFLFEHMAERAIADVWGYGLFVSLCLENFHDHKRHRLMLMTCLR